VIAATGPIPESDRRLLVVDSLGRIAHHPADALGHLLRPGDVVIANDAATIPASLQGTHARTGRPIEVRLAGRESLLPWTIDRVSAVVFGSGDFHTRTEDRPSPPELRPGDVLMLGPLPARVIATLGHPRLVSLQFDGTTDGIWEGLARHGRPVQYAHVPDALALWDTWTAIAGPPVAFEPPSAGFVLTWRLLDALQRRGVRFTTLTHAAGLSSTGDPFLDSRLPFDEAYEIPRATARLVNRAKVHRRRIVAIGTSVVRALEHAARANGVVRAGHGLATGRLGPDTRLRIVDAILSGTHEPGTSHYELLQAFVPTATLSEMDGELNRLEYRTHEFGDSIFVEAAIRVPVHIVVGNPRQNSLGRVLRSSAP
jgi:S-adenosylmethionine:tRNA ribosyltransferase-isomerase